MEDYQKGMDFPVKTYCKKCKRDTYTEKNGMKGVCRECKMIKGVMSSD